jgi:hypothetical protein
MAWLAFVTIECIHSYALKHGNSPATHWSGTMPHCITGKEHAMH